MRLMDLRDLLGGQLVSEGSDDRTIFFFRLVLIRFGQLISG